MLDASFRSEVITSNSSSPKQIETAKGLVTIIPACPSADIETMGVDAGLGFFWHHRIDLLKQALVKIAAMPQGHITIAHNAERVIIGYVTIAPPDEDIRWGRDHIEGLLELGGIEITPSWRRLHLSDPLMQATFSSGLFDRRIVIATGYRWCWDYEDSGLTVKEYRDCLHRVFQRYGFQFFDTDEPNIAWYPDNVLVGRIGAFSSAHLQEQFQGLLFEQLGSEYASSEFLR